MPWCVVCREECEVITIDQGIGYTEFWGAPGIDLNLVEVSDCCESEFVEDESDLSLLDEDGEYLDDAEICANHRLSLGLLPDTDEPCENLICSFTCPLI
jgi:hypothetical protein